MRFKRKATSKSPTKFAKIKRAKNILEPNSVKEAKAQLLNFISDKNGNRKPKQTKAYNDSRDKEKERPRKQKIGALVNNMQNQAVSNINLHMNFYQMGNKVLPIKSNTLTAESSKAGKMTRQRSEKLFAKNASLKKHASKKSVARGSIISKSTNFKAARQNDAPQEKKSKIEGTVKKNAQSKSRYNMQARSSNKWDNINKLMGRLKSKL